MNEVYIYVAGLFDGEGTVTMSHVSNKKHRSPVVSVTSTTKSLLDFLKENFGGTISRQKVYKSHHKQSWMWKLSHQKAIDFLIAIRPWIKEEEKARRADLIINEYKLYAPRNGKYTNTMLEDKRLFEKRFFSESNSATLSL